MSVDLRTTLTTAGGTSDVTRLIASHTLSGDYRQCCRTYEFEVVVSPDAGRVPYVYFPLGGTVQFSVGGSLRFYGVVVSKSKATDAHTMTVTCFDRGIYLKNNYATYLFRNQTPEAITRRVCTDFGIGVAALPTTGLRITRKFQATALYTILDTVWTRAGNARNVRYMQRFLGAKLAVMEKKRSKSEITLAQGVNLRQASYSESIETLVDRVSIYDKNDRLVRSVSNDAAIKAYGLMRRILRQDDGEDKRAEAKQLLEDNGVDRRVTVEVNGNYGLVTGETVYLKEPFTGQIGVFWIDSDAHTWRGGDYSTKLTLNFRNMMREGDSGADVKE